MGGSTVNTSPTTLARDVVSSGLGYLAAATQGHPIGWPACHPRRVGGDRGRGHLPRPVLLMQRQRPGSPPPTAARQLAIPSVLASKPLPPTAWDAARPRDIAREEDMVAGPTKTASQPVAAVT